MEKVLIIGGPGNISTSCIDYLISNGYKVAILKRMPDIGKGEDGKPIFISTHEGKKVPNSYMSRVESADKIKFYYGTRDDDAILKQVLDDFRPDMIADFVCFLPEQAKSIIKLIYNRVNHYVFVSTVDIYGYPISKIPMSENDPYNNLVSDYPIKKLECEKLFSSRYESKKFPLTIVRPAYSFGSIFLISFFSRSGGRFMVPRLRKGIPVMVPSDGKTLFHYGSAYNTGRMIARILTSEKTIGKSYTCAHNIINTQDDYIKLVASVLGVDPNIVHIPAEYLFKMGNEEVNNSLVSELTQYNIAFSIENFIKDFPDFKWDPLEPVIKDYLDWNDRMGNFADSSQVILDDRIIVLWQKCIRDFKLIK